jgi:hypothetical protein
VRSNMVFRMLKYPDGFQPMFTCIELTCWRHRNWSEMATATFCLNNVIHFR